MRNFLGIVLLMGTLNAMASDLGNIVRIDAGVVAGSGTTIRTYKGIPYAAPPVGSLRWQAPQPVKSWSSIRLAKTFSPSCVQPAVFPGGITQNEDCLTINIWTPAKAPNARLPVLFSIYGGGFEIGASAPGLYDGERLAAAGIVVVTFNYRVGVLGFLAHPELSRQSPQGVSGNYGLLDIVAALAWTQRNIAAFGGDPNNVTIWGESAGGSAVTYMLTAPQAKGLFHKAIANSAWCTYFPMRHLRETWGPRESAEATGARMGTLADLRAKAADEVVKLDAELGKTGMLNSDAIERGGRCRPVVDGFVVPEDPATLFAARKFHHVPLIAGTNADEGTASLFAPRVANLEQATAWLHATYGDEAAPTLAALYQIDSDGRARAGAIRLAGDSLFAMGTRAILRAAAAENPAVYQYEFTRVNGVGRRIRWGAYHGSDIGYTFGTLPESFVPPQPGDFNEDDDRLSRAMMGAIVQFAKTGNPNGKDLPKWPAYREKESYLEYGDTITVKHSLRSRELDALDPIFARRRAH